MSSKKFFVASIIIFLFCGLFIFFPMPATAGVGGVKELPAPYYWLKPGEDWSRVEPVIQKTLDVDLWVQSPTISSTTTASSLASYLAGKTTTCVKMRVGRDVFKSTGPNFAEALANVQARWYMSAAKKNFLQKSSPAYKQGWEKLGEIFALNGWVITQRKIISSEYMTCEVGPYYMAIWPDANGHYTVSYNSRDAESSEIATALSHILSDAFYYMKR